MRPVLAALLAALAVLAVACGDDSSDITNSPGSAGPTEPPAQTQAATEGGCQEVAAPPAKEDGGQRRPSRRLDASKTYTVTVETNCGSFSWELDLESAPRTSASIVALAESGFYDGTPFHRIVPGFVIQGGDPTGSGTGGPGYQTRDRPGADTTYSKGTVAMAKTAEEAPGTSGSQFFVVLDDAGGAGLTPDYAVVGKVSKGLDVVERIGLLGDAQQRPTQVVVIQRMTVRQS